VSAPVTTVPPKPAATTPDQPLFREAVIQARTARALGEIVLTPRASTTWLVLVSVVLGAAIVAFLALGTYTRRATVTGQLVPAAGLIRLHTPQPGVVVEKKVTEGQQVRKDDVLLVLSSDRASGSGREVQADIGLQVAERRRSLEAEILRNRGQETTELAHLERRLATLRAEAESVERQIEPQRLRLKLAEDARRRYQGLADRDYVAREQLYQKEAELAEQQTRLQALQRDLLAVQREHATTQRELDTTRARYANLNAQLQRAISSAQQELTEVEARRRVVITAPEAGQATLVAAEVGQAVDGTRALLSIVPARSQLEARLYAPSRTVGFVKPGDRVLLRYQSFPFQKFGQYEGRVVSVSNVAANSSELASFQLPDVPPGEPVYAITVRLSSQHVTAYGQQRPLAAGMRLDADILQETRRLWEWVLEPLYSVTGVL
jgi:membrane fusion protein